MPPPEGFTVVWVLRKLTQAGEAPAAYCVAAHAEDPMPGCTCPDHRYNGCLCKHIMALRACGLIPPAAPEAEAPAPSFAEGFRQAVNDHLAARRPAAAPAPSPVIIESPGAARRAHAPRTRAAIAEALPEGWQPGGMHPSRMAPVPASAEAEGEATPLMSRAGKARQPRSGLRKPRTSKYHPVS
jgi:hypothetical protein